MSIEGQGHFFTIYFPGFVCFVLYWAKISGERLQDHWSSGFFDHSPYNMLIQEESLLTKECAQSTGKNYCESLFTINSSVKKYPLYISLLKLVSHDWIIKILQSNKEMILYD